MIGLGSNRLTVCRRGGMSVTQAGRGGMEWLAGDGLRGRSPYSAQATAALKAQFPTQWPTIRDYGFDPANAAYINAINLFAPEDPLIMYSLIPSLGKVRWLNNGGGGYINSGLIPNSTTNIELIYKMSSFGGIVGSGQQYNTTDSMIVITYSGQPNSFGMYIGGANNIWYGSRQNDVPYKFDINVQRVIVKNLNTSQSWQANTGKTSISTNSRQMYIFTSNSANSDLARIGNCSFRYCKFTTDGEEHLFIPCKHTVEGELKMGMADMNAAEFKKMQGSGSFTISESPAS